MMSTVPYTSSNLRKHTNPNPLQQLLLARFHQCAGHLLSSIDFSSVLDVGCGEGVALHKLFRDSRIDCVGLDYSFGALRLASTLNPQSLFLQSSAFKLPFSDNQFDIVTCLEVLEHLDDPEAAIIELQRVARKALLLSVPNEPFFMAANFLRGKNVAALGNDPEHVNHWSRRGFVRFVSKHVNVIVSESQFPWTLALCAKKTSL